MSSLTFITGNKGKVREMQEKMKKETVTIQQKDLGYPEIQADTLEEVIHFGYHYVKYHIEGPFVIEDAGLFIEALHGFPGVYSKYVYYSIGLEGILHLLQHQSNRKAVFRSVYAYGEAQEEPRLFIGECLGTITQEQRGTQGFGYDPIFVPKGSTKTFAEMKTSEKNRYSHRGKALSHLLDFLKN